VEGGENGDGTVIRQDGGAGRESARSAGLSQVPSLPHSPLLPYTQMEVSPHHGRGEIAVPRPHRSAGAEAWCCWLQCATDMIRSPVSTPASLRFETFAMRHTCRKLPRTKSPGTRIACMAPSCFPTSRSGPRAAQCRRGPQRCVTRAFLAGSEASSLTVANACSSTSINPTTLAS
jgi:hypothetical protein